MFADFISRFYETLFSPTGLASLTIGMTLKNQKGLCIRGLDCVGFYESLLRGGKRFIHKQVVEIPLRSNNHINELRVAGGE